MTTSRPRPGAITARALRVGCAVVVLAAGLAACGTDNKGAASVALDPKVVKPGVLTVCTSFPYRPFEFKEDGKPAGFDIELASQVAERLQVKPVFVNANFNAISAGEPLNDGTCDVAVAALTITGERARVLDFSSPYFDAAQAMVVERGSGITTLADLGGGKIGVQAGTTGELYVTDNAPSDAEIVAYEDASEIDAALASGAIDAGVYDNSVVGDVVERNTDLVVADEFGASEQYGMAVKKDGSTDLLRFINNVLAQLREDGQYDQIYNRWFRGQ